MSSLVPPDRIENIVGVKRHPNAHCGRAVSAEQTVYILHSQECKDSGIDLRECLFSLALDRGIENAYCWPVWQDVQDQPVQLHIEHRAWVPDTDHPRRPRPARRARREQAAVTTLAERITQLGVEGCACRWEWRSLGILYGISFGNGWVRMTTAPDCPWHDESGQ